MRAIPDNNLAYPIHIVLSGGAVGSGFFVNAGEQGTFIATAKHVLYDPSSGALISKSGTVTSFSGDINDSNKNIFQCDFSVLEKNNCIYIHNKYDVVICKIGDMDAKREDIWHPTLGISVDNYTAGGIVGINTSNMIKRFEDVLIANDVYLFGYPVSIGIKHHPQVDFERPLIRRGIVSGKNVKNNTIIFDCAVYPGNSGGPLIEISEQNGQRHFMLIGIVSQFIPVEEKWIPALPVITNSGYSVASSANAIFELLSLVKK